MRQNLGCKMHAYFLSVIEGKCISFLKFKKKNGSQFKPIAGGTKSNIKKIYLKRFN